MTDVPSIATLERVIATLRREEFFSFDQLPLNEAHGLWDILPDVEDVSTCDPTDEGGGRAFLLWSRVSAERAFAEGHLLRAPFVCHWGSCRWRSLRAA